jgi:hypothetical protein
MSKIPSSLRYWGKEGHMTRKEADEIQRLQSEFVRILIDEGLDSPNLKVMLDKHQENREWLRLAEAALKMKRSAYRHY